MAQVKSVAERIEQGVLDDELGDILLAATKRFGVLRRDHMRKLHKETGQHP